MTAAARAPSPQPAVKLTLVGFQGHGNVGDEAILCGLKRLLDGSATIETIASGGIAPIPGAPEARRIHPWKLLPTVSAVRAIRASDVLVFSGGGLIHDYWPFVIPRYLAWVIAARMVGRPVVWAGVGVGPVRRLPWRILGGMALGLSTAVLVRDEASKAESARLIPRARVALAADPAYLLDPPPETERTGLGIVVRSPVPGDEHLAELLVTVMTSVAESARSRGERVDILAMHPQEDSAILEAIRRHASSIGGMRIRTVPGTPEEATAFLGSYHSLITMRLHGLILAAIAGVPPVPVVYDPKVAAAASDLGLGDVAIPLEGISSERIEAALEAVREPGRAVTVKERTSELRKRAIAIREAIVRVGR